jgi:acyl carrier protein
MENFNEKLAELLEVEKVEDADLLQEFDAWDSLTALSIIAMVDSDYNKSISGDQLKNFNTVGDLKKHLFDNQ